MRSSSVGTLIRGERVKTITLSLSLLLSHCEFQLSKQNLPLFSFFLSLSFLFFFSHFGVWIEWTVIDRKRRKKKLFTKTTTLGSLSELSSCFSCYLFPWRSHRAEHDVSMEGGVSSIWGSNLGLSRKKDLNFVEHGEERGWLEANK